MTKNNKSLLNKAFSIISNRDARASQVKDALRAMLSSRDDLNASEKNELYRHFLNLYFINGKDAENKYLLEKRTQDEAYSLVYKVECSSFARNRKDAVRNTLKEHRSESFPVIFYFCSYHERPAADHKDYQSKIYVDRFWRDAISDRADLSWLENPIEAYIRNHDILTVQDVVYHKPYLLTRPNCRHQLYPVDTWSVLTSSLSAIKRDLPDAAISGSGNKSRNEYNRRRKKFRSKLTATVLHNSKEKATV